MTELLTNYGIIGLSTVLVVEKFLSFILKLKEKENEIKLVKSIERSSLATTELVAKIETIIEVHGFNKK